MQALRKFLCDTNGATAIEYGLIAALIAVAAITAMQAMALTGNSVNSVENVAHDRFGPCVQD